MLKTFSVKSYLKLFIAKPPRHIIFISQICGTVYVHLINFFFFFEERTFDNFHPISIDFILALNDSRHIHEEFSIL